MTTINCDWSANVVEDIATANTVLTIFVNVLTTLTLVVILINRELWTKANAIIISLAISDSLVASFGLAVCIIHVAVSPNDYNNNLLEHFVDSFWILSLVISCGHLTLLSLERWIFITQANCYEKCTKPGVIAMSVAIIWLFAVTVFSITLISTVAFDTELVFERLAQIVMVTNFVIFIFLIVLYIHIFCFTSSHLKELRKMRPSDVKIQLSSLTNKLKKGKVHPLSSTANKKENKQKDNGEVAASSQTTVTADDESKVKDNGDVKIEPQTNVTADDESKVKDSGDVKIEPPTKVTDNETSNLSTVSKAVKKVTVSSLTNIMGISDDENKPKDNENTKTQPKPKVKGNAKSNISSITQTVKKVTVNPINTIRGINSEELKIKDDRSSLKMLLCLCGAFFLFKGVKGIIELLQLADVFGPLSVSCLNIIDMFQFLSHVVYQFFNFLAIIVTRPAISEAFFRLFLRCCCPVIAQCSR